MVAFVCAFATPVSAADRPDQSTCITAYEQGQKLRRSGQLRDARDALITCLQDTCSPVLREDCAQWMKDLESVMPSIVPRAHDEGGRDRADVRVSMDGQLLVSRLDGRAIEVDPGEHKFVFRAENGPTVEMRVVIVEGQRAREVAAVIPLSPKPQVEVFKSRPVPVLTYVFGGVAIAAAGSGTFFGLSGVSDRSGLSDCKPSCPDDRVSPVETKFLVADISWTVALVAGVASAYFFFTRPTVERSANIR